MNEGLNNLNINEERKNIIEKVLKLLDLANSSDKEGEIENARKMASKLMAKYQISIDETKKEGLIIKREKFYKKRMESWLSILLNAITKYNGVAIIRENTYNNDIELVTIGEKDDIEISMFIFESVFNQVQNLVKETKKKNKLTVKQTNSYRNGLVTGIINNLKELSNGIIKYKEEEGLIPVDDNLLKNKRAIEEYLKMNNNEKLKNSKVNYNSDRHFKQGYNDYKKVSIRNPLTSNNSNSVGVLT